MISRRSAGSPEGLARVGGGLGALCGVVEEEKEGQKLIRVTQTVTCGLVSLLQGGDVRALAADEQISHPKGRRGA